MMKNILLAGLMCVSLMLAAEARAHAQLGIVTGILKRVIMAIDLRIQRKQTETIVLQDAQKQLENLMQKTRLADIADWVQQQKDLYEEYYQELWQVKHALKYYSIVKAMIDKQAWLIAGYKQAYSAVVRDKHFSADEIGQIGGVYQGILQESTSIVEALNTVINAFVTEMDDGERLTIINSLSHRIDRNYRRLENFTQSNILLSLQRSKDEQDLNMIKALYGIY